MSVQLLSWAYEQQTGSPSRKSVLLALANRANHDTGLCYPSILRIAEETELSRSTVIRALKDLESAGLISRQRTRANGKLSTYHYSFPSVTMTQPGVTVEPRPEVTVTPKPEEVLEPEENLWPRTAAPRPRNELWDTLTAIFGEAETRSAQTLRGRIVRSLAQARASPDEILSRAKRWPLHFDGATLTETALEKHWTTLARKPLRRTT